MGTSATVADFEDVRYILTQGVAIIMTMHLLIPTP